MSADARPFVPSSDAVSSESPSMPDISGGAGSQSGPGSGTRNEHLSTNQQQLGDRLYPKVIDCLYFLEMRMWIGLSFIECVTEV